jgi:hypothetical protein
MLQAYDIWKSTGDKGAEKEKFAASKKAGFISLKIIME